MIRICTFFCCIVLLLNAIVYSQQKYDLSFRDSIHHSNNKIIAPPNVPIEDKQVEYFLSADSGKIEFDVYESSVNYNKYDKNLYVCDPVRHKIFILNDTLEYINTLGTYGQAPNEYVEPAYIDFDKNGRYIITDTRLMRAKLFNKDNSIITSFHSVGTGAGDYVKAYFNIQGNVIIFGVTRGIKNKKLFEIRNLNGDIISEFGEVYPTNDTLLYITGFNAMCYDLDNDDNVYCTYFNHPIIRKYNKNGQLMFEGDYYTVDDSIHTFIMEKEKIIKKSYLNNPTQNNYIPLRLVKCMSIDNEYLYIIFWDSKDSPIYVFDKNNFSLIKKIRVFRNNDVYAIVYMDASASQYIYAVSRFHPNLLGILKFKK